MIQGVDFWNQFPKRYHQWMGEDPIRSFSKTLARGSVQGGDSNGKIGEVSTKLPRVVDGLGMRTRRCAYTHKRGARRR
jgi:hypothetical protein